MLLEHGKECHNLRPLRHDAGTGFIQAGFCHSVGFLKQGQTVQGILPLPAGKDLPRKMFPLHPADVVVKRCKGFAVGRLRKNRLAGKIIMAVTDGAYLHDAPVFFQTNAVGIIQILMLHAAFDSRPRQHRLEQGQGQAGHIFVAEGHGNKKHIYRAFPVHSHNKPPALLIEKTPAR